MRNVARSALNLLSEQTEPQKQDVSPNYRDPAVFSEVLHAASPLRARAFVVAQHEQACAGVDEAKTQFWAAVLQCLCDNGGDEDGSALPA